MKFDKINSEWALISNYLKVEEKEFNHLILIERKRSFDRVKVDGVFKLKTGCSKDKKKLRPATCAKNPFSHQNANKWYNDVKFRLSFVLLGSIQ